MKRTAISTSGAPAAIGPYSQAVSAAGLLFCSGQIALDPETGQLVGSSDVRAETQKVMQNLSAVLTAGGASFSGVIKATIFLTDLSDFATVNEVYGSYFSGDAPPARACVEVAALPRGATVEIEMIALTDVG